MVSWSRNSWPKFTKIPWELIPFSTPNRAKFGCAPTKKCPRYEKVGQSPSRRSKPKFSKFGHRVSIGQTPNPAKFCYPAKKVSEISAVENLCCRESAIKFTKIPYDLVLINTRNHAKFGCAPTKLLLKFFAARKSRPKFTKSGEQESIGKTLHAIFYRCRSNSVTRKALQILHPSLFGAPGDSCAKVHQSG